MTMTNPDFNFPRKSLLNFAITIIKNHGAITRKLLIQSEKCSLGAGIKIYMGNVKLSSLQQLCTQFARWLVNILLFLSFCFEYILLTWRERKVVTKSFLMTSSNQHDSDVLLAVFICSAPVAPNEL